MSLWIPRRDRRSGRWYYYSLNAPFHLIFILAALLVLFVLALLSRLF